MGKFVLASFHYLLFFKIFFHYLRFKVPRVLGLGVGVLDVYIWTGLHNSDF